MRVRPSGVNADPFDWRNLTGPMNHVDQPFAARSDGIVTTATHNSSIDVTRIRSELEAAIDGADWERIRARIVPLASAHGQQRASARRSGELPDLAGAGSIVSLDRLAAGFRTLQRQWTGLARLAPRVR
jgi:hypothetical protein